MAYEKDQKVLDDVKAAVASIKNDAGMASKKALGADLMNEDIHEISLDGFDYEQISAEILEETEELFYFSRACNRFAPQYLQLCRSLKKAIDHLGSVFLTKTALSYNGRELPKLELLTAVRLNEMCSFNFRKLQLLLHQKQEQGQGYDLEVFDLMMDFANVMARLRSTEYKANHMEFGPMEERLKYSKGSSSFATNRKGERKYSDPASFREASAYSIDRTAIEQMGVGSMASGNACSAGNLDSEQQLRSEWGHIEPETAVQDCENGDVDEADAALSSVENAETGEHGVQIEAKTEEPGNTCSARSELRSDLDSEQELRPMSGHIEPGTVTTDGEERLPLATELPPYQEILARAKERNPEGEEIQLTIDEIMFLLSDSNFQREMPELAEQCMQALEMFEDSG